MSLFQNKSVIINNFLQDQQNSPLAAFEELIEINKNSQMFMFPVSSQKFSNILYEEQRSYCFTLQVLM